MPRGLLVRAFIMAILATTAPLPAATYALFPDEVLIRKSDLIARGRVGSVESLPGADSGIVTLIRVDIDRTFKGGERSSVLVEQPGGRLGDDVEVYPGTGTFFEGEEVLLMLEERGSVAYRLTDFAMGKFRASLAPDGTEYYRRDGLKDAAVLVPGGSVVTGASVEADRDAVLFEAFIEEQVGGHAPLPDYFIPSRDAAREGDEMNPTAGFTFLGSSPSHWVEFASGTPVTFRDKSGGDPGSQCVNGCHQEVGLGVTAWNNAPGAQILVQYGGTDGSIGSSCLSSLDNQIQFNDPCDEISDLSGCTGTLALGGFSATSSGGDTGCSVQGTLSFNRITAGRILINNGVGSCLGACSYTDLIAHETGHTIGAGHSNVSSALMGPFLQGGRCGALQADDLAFAQCAYEGSPSPCAGTPPLVTSVETVRRKGVWRARVFGADFTKGAVVMIDSGSGFVPAPKTRKKKRRKLVAKPIDAIWPAGPVVDLKVVLPTGCESNVFSATR